MRVATEVAAAMTNHVVRLYAFAGALLVLFLTWAAIAAHPWAPTAGAKADPRWTALAAREQRLRHESLVVQRVVARRWRAYRVQLAARRRAISAAVSRHERQLAAARASASLAVVVLGARLRLLGGPLGARRDPATRDDHEDLVIQRRSFRAMGTDVALFLAAEPGPAAEAALESAEREFERVEALLSRFRPESELSALNRAGRLEAGDDLLAVVDLALDARARTGGRFDPTVHDALVAAGYDRTFEEVAPDGASEHAAARCGGAVRIAGRTIELEPGTHLDLGGIGKGYTVDRAAAILSAAGPALVDAGGDIAARGRPDALGWRVGIETPGDTLDARPRGRRDRDLRPRPAPLAPRRGGAPPSDRPRPPAAPPTATCSA